MGAHVTAQPAQPAKDEKAKSSPAFAVGGPFSLICLLLASACMPTSSGQALTTTAAVTTTSTASNSSIIVSPSSATIAPGTTLQFYANGGVSPYTYAVSGSGSIDANTGIFTAPSTETTTEITATDSTGLSGSASVTISYAVLTVSPGSVVMSPSATLTFQVSGGLSPYSYNIAYGLGTITSTGLFTAPSTSGVTQIYVVDSNGDQVFVTITVGNGGTATTSSNSGCSLITAVAATSTTMTCDPSETLSSTGYSGSCGGVSQAGVPSSPSYTVGCAAGTVATGSAYCCASRTAGASYDRTISGTGTQYLQLFCGVGEATVSATGNCTTNGATTPSYLTTGTPGQEGYTISCSPATDTATLQVTCSGTVAF